MSLVLKCHMLLETALKVLVLQGTQVAVLAEPQFSALVLHEAPQCLLGGAWTWWMPRPSNSCWASHYGSRQI